MYILYIYIIQLLVEPMVSYTLKPRFWGVRWGIHRHTSEQKKYRSPSIARPGRCRDASSGPSCSEILLFLLASMAVLMGF